MHFGEHLMIDGYGAPFEKLESKELCFDVINELPNLLGMKKICEPNLVRFPGNDAKDPGGWSGYVMIAESHISIHTFSKRGFLTADVYTCHNGLDVEKIKNYFKDKFELRDLEINFVKRGLKYPEKDLYDTAGNQL